ncbi:hypothetical protein K9K77_01380 [Candidatus Babeliales bacterium]|nr:hypothetical protein [Candidatus Babeliales bacterium]
MIKKRAIALLCIMSFGVVHSRHLIKECTTLIYIAADNDLDIFAERNIKQMMKVGQSEHLNIVLCVNTSEKKYSIKTTKIISIEKNNARILKKTTLPQYTDSGKSETLVDFCTYAIEEFPARNYVLIFWNHGTGALDPFVRRQIPTSDIFLFDAESDPSTSPCYLDNLTLTNNLRPPLKAICFDDSTGNFLTEKTMVSALQQICEGPLKGKKFDIIGFDACLMAMIETAFSIKDFANIMVASQEVELGAGWDYKKVFTPFLFKNLSPHEFGKHIVEAYSKTYNFIDDFTLSCIDLTKIDPLVQNIQQLAQFLHSRCTKKSNTLFFDLIKASRHKHSCTHFDEPDYIDLHHFYKNLLHNVAHLPHCNNNILIQEIDDLKRLLITGMEFMQQTVIMRSAGKYFPEAQGLSIYFPEHTIHKSYKSNKFATHSYWFSFLKSYFS